MSKKSKSSGKEKLPNGRPRKTLDDLPEGWREIALGIYKDGGTDVEVKCAIAPEGSIAMSNDLWDRFMEEESSFSETILEGRKLAEVWHQKVARQGMFMGKQFNAGVFGLVMKNRFGWSEKQDNRNEHSGTIAVGVITGIDNAPGQKPDDEQTS